MRGKVLIAVFILVSILLCGTSVFAGTQEVSEEITRLQCIKEVIQDGCEVPEAATFHVFFYNGYFPLSDMRYYDIYGDDNYIVWAYMERITYGKENVSDEEVALMNKEVFEKTEKELDLYLSENGLTRCDLFVPFTVEDGFCYYEGKDFKVPENLIFPNTYKSGLYFCPEEIATMEECVAFFVRSMKDDEIYKDLDVTWQYAKEIGFIKDSDNLTPDTLLTRDILDTLLERFKNYEHRNLSDEGLW